MVRTTEFQILVVLRLPTFRSNFATLTGFHIFHTLTPQTGLGSHSPSRCWLFQNFHFMKFHIYILSLSQQVLVCHSPWRCLVYILQADVVFFNQIFHIFHNLTLTVGFGFWLSMDTLSLPSPSRCWPFKKCPSVMTFHILFLQVYNFVCHRKKATFFSALNPFQG